MAIPELHRLRHAYHFTSIENLGSIIDSGLLSTNIKNSRGITHRNVAEENIQNRRSTMLVPGANGRCVHDYVPFYFAQKTPMQLAVLHKKNVDQELIIYFSISISVLENRPGVFFTNASANTDIAPNFYPASEAHQLNTLNWQAIDNSRWSYPNDDERHQKMAELLIPDQVHIAEVGQIITWNTSISNAVRTIFQEKDVVPPQITENSRHYYADPGNWNYSLVTGPFFLKRHFEDTVKSINADQRHNTKFPSLESAVLAIRQNFCIIQELSDIDGLGANYGPHRDDVGTHSRRVAELVRLSPEYAQLDDHNKAVLEMAAYMHDIGKGPKSRWNNSFMDKPDSNHARKSLPMLQRILTEDISGVPADSVRKLVMLVTYDDLLGDIAANGRDKKQLFDIVTCQDDINMLVALSKADIGSLSQAWLYNTSGTIDNLRAEVLWALQGPLR
ncbi:TPA: DarT ssDNA thymidine ADP-ribosyltransferase family protein [Serratia marcescens]